MQTPLRVLFVEDSEIDAELTTAELKRGGFLPTVQRVETRPDMEKCLRDSEWDLIICDYLMPRFSAAAALSTLKASGIDLPFIIASGAVTAEDAVSLLKDKVDGGLEDHRFMYRIASYLFHLGAYESAYTYLHTALELNSTAYMLLYEYAPFAQSNETVTNIIDLYQSK